MRVTASPTELCDLYIADAEAGRLLTRRKVAKKASIIATDRGRIERHIKPRLGRMKVTAVTSTEIEDFLHSVSEGQTAAIIKTDKKRGISRVRGGRGRGRGTATRTVGLLGAIFTYAVRHRMRPDNAVVGANAAFERFEAYEPRAEPGAWLAGGKRMGFDRIEWITMPDPATAAAPLQNAEIDWWEQPLADLAPALKGAHGVRLEIADPLGNVALCRPNCLAGPTSAKLVRQAMQLAIGQADAMRAVAGDD